MIKAAVIALCLMGIASLTTAATGDKRLEEVPRKTSTVTDAEAWRELTGDTRMRRATAQLDTTFLLDHRFDYGGVHCDAMGWTRNDDTQQLDNYWHVDNFAGLAGINGGLVPLEGSQSMWCGARPDNTDLVKCSYVNLPGYANDWGQWIRTDRCLSVTGDVDLSFQIFWNSESEYDFTYIQWDACDENWQDLVVNSNGALDGLGQWDTTLTVPASMHTGSIRFRFLFRSDAASSDGDGSINTDGACTIDALRVTDDNGVVLTLEDFEGEAVGEHDGDDWVSGVTEGYGDLAFLFRGIDAVQDDPCFTNGTCVWGFFNGSTSNYGCSTPPHPEQLTVPYENARAQYVDQQIWSPWIELSGTSVGVELEFGTYWDLSLSNLVFSDWHVRGIDSTAANPCPSMWRGDGVLDFGDSRTWRRDAHRIAILIPAGSTHIQVSLDVLDYCQIVGPCAGVCHSHAPLYDNVAVYRLGAAGPQWVIQDVHQFQDNFPDDGTITGPARADMAMDNNWDEPTQAIVPGDSAVVRVSDPDVGLATEAGGKAAVFCYVRSDGPNSGTAPVSLICDPRYEYIADETWDNRIWHKFQADTCYGTGGAAIPDAYNFDFCDNLFVPGDSVWFFWGARDADGVSTYASAALATPGNQTGDGDEAASNSDEFQVLPAVGRDEVDGGRGGDVLYVDGMNFRGAQPFFDTAFASLAMLDEVDRYDIRGPSSGVSNHPGSRVKNVVNQLVAIYRQIIWNTGDLETAFSDGTGGNTDKSDDTGMCLAFLDNLELRGGIYLNGDQVATEWLQMTAAAALTLKTTYMEFDVFSSDHQPVVGYNPWGVGVTGGIFSDGPFVDTLVTQGGCPTPNTFDVLEAHGANTFVEMNYHDWSANSRSAPAIVSQLTENPGVVFVGFVLSGFSFHYIRDYGYGGVPDRFIHMEMILRYLGLITGSGPGDAGASGIANNSLGQNVPNPFNPTTTIRYQVKEPGPVSLRIYNVAGQLVKTLVDGHRVGGQVHRATWNGLNDSGQQISSGVYFYKLVARNFTQTKKMVVLK